MLRTFPRCQRAKVLSPIAQGPRRRTRLRVLGASTEQTAIRAALVHWADPALDADSEGVTLHLLGICGMPGRRASGQRTGSVRGLSHAATSPGGMAVAWTALGFVFVGR